MPDIVVVSPHFDDAVLSCWNVLDRGRESVTVVTVFGGAPPPGRLWPWDAKPPGASDSASRVAERKEENRRALATTGSLGVSLELLEVQYAEVGGGRLEPHELEPHLFNARIVFAPAGVGREVVHPDHATVRDVVTRLRPDAVLYADQPYCRFPADLDVAGERTGYTREIVTISGEAARRKVAAIRCYAGEVQRLEGLAERMTRPEEEFRHEVLWWPALTTSG